MTERLKAAAIMRNDEVFERGFRSHRELRQALGDDDPDKGKPYDVDGFVTTEGRFVDRYDARAVAIAAGQIHPSSDVDW
jgi:hypothetical protein